MRSIEHEAILFCFVGKLDGVLRKDRQLRMQRSCRYGRKGKQVHPQVSERRQQFVRFSGIVSYGCGEVVDASYMKRHSCLQAVQRASVLYRRPLRTLPETADKHTAADREC